MSAQSLHESLQHEMALWEAAGLRRTLAGANPEGPGDPDGASEKGERVDFASNDYLGLARDPAIIEAAKRALDGHGTGGRASRLLGGGCRLHEQAEAACAAWLGAEASLLFPSGYQANIGVITALARHGDALFSDRLNHASLIDAARLSRARVHVHAHLDLPELERQLSRASHARRRLVVTEGIFSMEGDGPDLGRLNELCAHYDAWIVLDEAHSVGVLGPEGAGAWAEATLGESDSMMGESRLAARVVTAGKALGVSGAFVAGSTQLREHLINRARTFLFTTAPSPVLAGALIAAIVRCRKADEERAAVLARAGELAQRLGLEAPRGAILPLRVGDPERAVELSQALAKKGFDARAVRPPTVPEGAAGLRLVLHAGNTEGEVDELARELETHAASVSAPLTPTPGSVKPAADLQRALFVAGTDTNIGKTIVSALLLIAARRYGDAAYWKPVQTGDDSDTKTVQQLTGATRAELMPPAWELPLPASPHAAALEAGIELRPERLEEGLQGLLRTLSDTRLIIELAGGLLVPYRLDPVATQADWLEKARAPLVLVARSGLGTLNHTLLSLEALRRRHLEPRALFLVGETHASNRETLERLAFVPHIFEVPLFKTLHLDALNDWCLDNDMGALLAL